MKQQGFRRQVLNLPTRIGVHSNADAMPVQIVKDNKTYRIKAVVDRWLAEDKWWRSGEQRRRLYIQVLDDHQRTLTIFCDLQDGSWWSQHSGAPSHQIAN